MKKINILKSMLLIVLLSVFGVANAQQTAEKYVIETDYLLYLPDGYNAADTITKWPLLMFLHGAGETGNDIEKVKVHGPARLIEEGKKFPFIVVSPQSRQYGWRNHELMGLLGNLGSKYKIDDERVYLTGLSMGGYGTWSLAAEFPFFAAIIPICGGGNANNAYKLRHMPIWCFHGAKDDIVPISQSQQMVDAVRKYNEDVKFTIYPEANHDSWTETYTNDSIYDWLLQHKRFEYKEITLNSDVLERYAGSYQDEYGGAADIIFEEGKLFLNMGRRFSKQEIKPASELEFFVFEKHPYSMLFDRDESGNITGIRFLSDRIDYYKKVK